MRFKRAGMILPMVLIVSVVLVLILMSATQILKKSSSDDLYLTELDRTRHLADTGLNDAMKQLASQPDPSQISSAGVAVPAEQGVYSNVVSLRTVPINPIYYVITTATRTVQGHHYYCELHSYVRVSNTAAYFAAITDALTISHPVDIGQGKVYASTLTFVSDLDAGTLTKVLKAEYLNVCYQQIQGSVAPWDGSAKIDVKITQPTSGDPTKLPAPLIFPQLLDSDIDRYRAIAGPHTSTGTFSGEIYPPGFSDFPGESLQDAGDLYRTPDFPGHTVDNKQHVYFYDGDMHIQGNVHGQVLFVAAGDIYITGNLTVASGTNYPGSGEEMGSTAHQAVLITRKNVFIDNKMVVTPPTITTQQIQAMIIAPNGSVVPISYNDDNVHLALKLDFKGSLILSTMNTTPLIPAVFRGGRTYSYMDTLLTETPPYLPAVSQIYCSLENTWSD